MKLGRLVVPLLSLIAIGYGCFTVAPWLAFIVIGSILWIDRSIDDFKKG